MADDPGSLGAESELGEDEFLVGLEEVGPDCDDPKILAAEVAYAEGRFVPHARVAEWLDSIGTANELPVPYSWRK